MGLLAEGREQELSEELRLSGGREYVIGTVELGLSTGRVCGIAELMMGVTEDKGVG